MEEDRTNLQGYGGVQQGHLPEHVAAMPEHKAKGFRRVTGSSVVVG
jgi:hypothetical protein